MRRLPGGRNALRRTWESFLSGRKPNHTITFDPDAASKERDSFFITPMHPLARQAALYFSGNETAYLHLHHYSKEIPAGEYLFSIFAWKYTGFTTYTKLVTVCENETVMKELPYILEESDHVEKKTTGAYDWTALEDRHVQMWLNDRETHKRDVQTTITFKLESLANTHRNRIRSLEQQVRDAFDDNIRRMRQSELESAQENYSRKAGAIKDSAEKAEIYTTLLVNGVLTILEG